ncbi:DUF5688 family protein [Blautia coccoides]|uniref:Uncharacterized protein n=1 Tax=Blautia hominis TaxID=2025493 RepID=A0ABQ0B3H1_9FIRM|nr:DUF5688 family protein [Blautia coccoides]MCQ4640749.1 DUF5688 family protein [Blautia coccoides]
MNYEEFQEELQQEVTEKLDPHTTVAITQLQGNNGVFRSELKFMTPQNDNLGTVNLDGYYESFLNGMELSQIANEIVNLQEQLRSKSQLVAYDLSDFNQVRDRIIFRLVNAKKNTKQLTDKPHLPFLDLAVVYYIVLDKSSSGVTSSPIYYKHLKHWNVDTATLHACAQSNGLRIFPPTLEPISSVLKEIVPNIEDDFDLVPAYVLSNKELHWGATSILYDQVLQNIGDLLHMNYYVAPSSIHETIIYPDFFCIPREELNATVQFVNKYAVKPEEILSNHIYYYDRIAGRLKMP